MQVKTFTGTSTKDIMAEIKAELGPEAIILSNQKRSRSGKTYYEIMAALDAPTAVEKPVAQIPSPMPLAETGDDTVYLREEWSSLRKQLMAVLKPQMDLEQLTPRQQLVVECLEREGVHEGVLLDLWKRFRRAPLSPTLAVMNDMISVTPWTEMVWPHKFHLLAGPYGSGKTSTTLRLALAMKKKRRNLRIMIVNADRSQGKGRLYLRHYAELSGFSYKELDSQEQWAGLEAEARDHDLVLIDLPGLPGRESLGAWLHRAAGDSLPGCHIHLVLSPLFGRAQMESFISRMRTPQTTSIIWTKLDEACNYGEILNQASAAGVPISLLSTGPDLKHSLALPQEQGIWKLLLRHELPEAVY